MFFFLQDATNQILHGIHYHHTVQSTRQRNLNLGFSVDFKSGKKGTRNPIKRLDELRHHLVGEAPPGGIQRYLAEYGAPDTGSEVNEFSAGEAVLDSAPSDPKLSTSCEHLNSIAQIKSLKPSKTVNPSSDMATPDQETFDTFEQCLHAANERDSLLSFYYKDENNPNVVKVTEIFGVEEPQTRCATPENMCDPGPIPEPPVGRVPMSEDSFGTSPADDSMVWDHYMESARICTQDYTTEQPDLNALTSSDLNVLNSADLNALHSSSTESVSFSVS